MIRVDVERFGVPSHQQVLRWARLSLAVLIGSTLGLGHVTAVWADSPPILGILTATPSNPFALDTSQQVVLTVTFSDPDPGDTHNVTIDWDDGTSCEAHGPAPDLTVTEYCSIDNDGNVKSITASHRYLTTGVFAPIVTVATEGYATGGKKAKQYRYVLIFDDNKGHIKGSGGLDYVHPYNQFSTANGPTQFGFTVAYNDDGTFRSSSRMRYMVYNDDLTQVFSFASTSFKWMVINGPYALLSGTGTINGVTYNFVLSIIDGGLQSSPGPDRFRIRITNLSGSVYYDNEFAPTPTRDIMLFDPTTVAGGIVEIIYPASAAAVHNGGTIVIGDAPADVVDSMGRKGTQFIFFPVVSAN